MRNRNTNLLFALAIFCICMTVVIVARLFYLQILCHDHYLKQSLQNYIRYESIRTIRGEILDCNGYKIATNRPLINLYWQGTGQRSLQPKQLELLKKISLAVPSFRVSDELLVHMRKAERTNEKLLLYTDMSPEELSSIEEMCGSHKNILIKNDILRFYPYKQSACHIIGYLSGPQHEQLGNMGLEKYLEDTLQGSVGTGIKTINSFGKKITAEEIEPSVKGTTIQSTLDISLQLLAEKVFTAPHEGAFILLDPADGAVKALVSLPNFDPSIFLSSIDHNEWAKLREKKPFLNKAIQCTYPPGSLFKLITISAGLEHNLVAQNDTFMCEGSFTLANRTYRCHNQRGHGELSVKQGLARSCNILFYQLGTTLSIDSLADYAFRFGLGKPTGVIFPEQTGCIPTSQWKRETKGEQWWQGETLSAVIGQGYVSVTPLQIARAIGGIFTGHLVKPRILQDEPIHRTPVPVKPETLRFLQESMRSVVTEGTGRNMQSVPEITLFAKTGTAQVVAMKPGKVSKEHREHGWVVGYFSCKDHAPLVFVILAEHTGSSRVPVAIAKEFLRLYRQAIC